MSISSGSYGSDTQEAAKFASLLKRTYACHIPGHSVCWPLKHGRHLQLSTNTLKQWGAKCSTGDATIHRLPEQLQKDSEPSSFDLHPIPKEYAGSEHAFSIRSRTSFGPFSSSYFSYSQSNLSSVGPGPGYYSGKGLQWIGEKVIGAIVAVNITRTAGQHLQQIARWQSQLQEDSRLEWDGINAMKMFAILDDVADMSRPIYPRVGQVRAASVIEALHVFLDTQSRGMPYLFVKRICIPLIILRLIALYKAKSNAQGAIVELLEILTSTPVSEQSWHCLFATIAILKKEQLAPPLDIARYSRYLQILEFGSIHEELVSLAVPHGLSNILYLEKHHDDDLMDVTRSGIAGRIRDLSIKCEVWNNETSWGRRIRNMEWEQGHKKMLSDILDGILLLHRIPYGVKAAISQYSTLWGTLRECGAPDVLKVVCGRLLILEFIKEYHVLHFDIELFRQIISTLLDAVLELHMDTQGFEAPSIADGWLDSAGSQSVPTDLIDINKRAEHMTLSLHAFIVSKGPEMSHRLAESICIALVLLKLAEICKSASQLDYAIFTLFSNFFESTGSAGNSQAMDTDEWYLNQNRSSHDYLKLLDDYKHELQDIDTVEEFVDRLSRSTSHNSDERLNITMLTKSSLRDFIATVGKSQQYTRERGRDVTSQA
ncbi:hypothetical protein BU17DRAFT_90747 [Hysterangium stoloniferum]|nr:hypothetical protein BU17DRAFT_90747 [Hysterangium stoloniferum]